MCRRQILANLAGHARVSPKIRDDLGARFGSAREFAEHNFAVRAVDDHPRLDAVQADKAQPAQDVLRAKKRGQRFLVTQAILERQYDAPLPYQRRQQTGKLVLGRGLESDQDEVTRANLFRRARTLGVSAEIAVDAPDKDASLANHLVIRPQEKMNVVAGLAELRPVEAAERTASHDRRSHRSGR